MPYTNFTEEQVKQTAIEVARQYLQTVKRWKTEEYFLETIRLEGTEEAPIAVLEGVYKADLQAQQRGGGQSVQLYIDVQKRNVVRELAYQ